MSSPIQPQAPDPALLRRVWENALKARAKGYSNAEIDAAVNDAVGGNFKELTAQLMGSPGVLGLEGQADPDVQAAQKGVGPLAAAALTPALGLSLGWLERLSPTMREYGRMASQSAPLNAAVGRLTGGGVAGLAAGQLPTPAVFDQALAPISGLAKGAYQGGIMGTVSGLAQQPDLLHPDLKSLGTEIAANVAAGGASGLAGDIMSNVYNPGAYAMRRAIETSAPLPETEFTQEKGLKGLEEPPAANPVLDRLMAERGNLPTLATKYVRRSQPAAEAAKSLIQNRLDVITAAKNRIANDPTVGYDAVLNNATLENPADVSGAKQLLQDLGRRGAQAEPTGRNLFSAYKLVRDDVAQMNNQRARGTSRIDTEELHAQGQRATQLRDYLSKIPGFDELQAQVQPYMDRENSLRTLLVQLQGRGVYLKGQTPSAPPKGVRERLKEAGGLSTYFGTERAARSMVPALFGTTTPADMLANIQALERNQVMSRYAAPAATGAVAGLLGIPQVRDRLGLLQP